MKAMERREYCTDCGVLVAGPGLASAEVRHKPTCATRGPKYCFSCGAFLMGSLTKHGVACDVRDLTENAGGRVID